MKTKLCIFVLPVVVILALLPQLSVLAYDAQEIQEVNSFSEFLLSADLANIERATGELQKCTGIFLQSIQRATGELSRSEEGRENGDEPPATIPTTPLVAEGFHISEHNTANATATIIGLPGTSRIVLTMTLERMDGENVLWYTSWTRTVRRSMLALTRSAAVTADGTYRLRICATVTRNGVDEHISFES